MLLATRVPAPTSPPISSLASLVTAPGNGPRTAPTPISWRVLDHDDLWGPVSDFTLTALRADCAELFPQWALGRVAQDSWTLVAASGNASTPLGTTSAWRASVCSTVQSSPEAVLIGDLRRRRQPVQRAAAQTWGLRAYIGAPVCAPDGTRLGSLCGWSTRPSHRGGADEERLRARVSEHARFLGATLSRELTRISDDRREDWDQVAGDTPSRHGRRGGSKGWRGVSRASGGGVGQRDRMTQLVSSGSFEQLLAREDNRARRVADAAAVLVLDASGVSSVTSTLGLRQVARTLAGLTREVAGADAVLARTGPRQFTVLAVASALGNTSSPAARPLAELVTDDRTGQLADHLREQLTAALPRLRTGLRVRAGSTPLAQVWVRAQTDVVTLRRPTLQD